MLAVFDPYRGLTFAALCLRMVLAFLCGGIVGLEREYKRRPAGFRTHILICVGATMTTITSQYLYLEMHYQTDMARLGAQVVAGIGFIGAGTIIVTRRKKVKGLTTAAGLWATAIIGLSFGAGFYEGGLFAALLILLAEMFFSKLAYQVRAHVPEVNLYVEYTDKTCLEHVMQRIQEEGTKILNLEVMRSVSSEHHCASALFLLRLGRKVCIDQLIHTISEMEGVVAAEEL